MNYVSILIPEPGPLGETRLLARERAMALALLVKSPRGGWVESVLTRATQRFFELYVEAWKLISQESTLMHHRANCDSRNPVGDRQLPVASAILEKSSLLPFVFEVLPLIVRRIRALLVWHTLPRSFLDKSARPALRTTNRRRKQDARQQSSRALRSATQGSLQCGKL